MTSRRIHKDLTCEAVGTKASERRTGGSKGLSSKAPGRFRWGIVCIAVIFCRAVVFAVGLRGLGPSDSRTHDKPMQT